MDPKSLIEPFKQGPDMDPKVVIWTPFMDPKHQVLPFKQGPETWILGSRGTGVHFWTP